MRKEAIIDIKPGNVTGIDKEDTIILKGDYLNEDSNFVDKLVIVIKNEKDEAKEFPINCGGYNIKLFIGKFTSEKCDDIFIYGETGGSGGYAIAVVYKYYDGELKEIFNGESFSEKYKCISKYLEGYKVEAICPLYERKYILDISSINKDYLSLLYSKDGKIISNEDPIVSYVNNVELINNIKNNLLQLQIYQRIIGINNSNTLGGIITNVSLECGEIKVCNQYAITEGECISVSHRSNSIKEEILEQLPESAILINFNKFGGNNGLIREDIDQDGTEEVLCGYKHKDNQYIAAFREYDGVMKLIDTIGGEGYDISDLFISKLKARSNNNILVGWRIGSIWSVLDILEFKNNKFNKLLTGDKINFSKLELIDVDNKRGATKDIALWSHESGEAYKVQIYTFRGDVFEKTYKSDREYFGKVEEYYRNLINRTRETPQYLYFLIDAQWREGKKKDAIANINKALKHPKPYPSVEELKRIRKRING